MLALSDVDSNADSAIDQLDEPVVRLIVRPGGNARALRPGRSAAWSPDGRHIAVLSGGRTFFFDAQGRTVEPAAGSPGGRLVLASSRSAAQAPRVWSMDLGMRRTDEVAAADARKLLWLGALAPDGRAVFSNAQRTDIFVGDPATPAGAVNVTRDRHIDLDPAWSADGRRIVYVSNDPADGASRR